MCKSVLSTISFPGSQQTIALDLTGHQFLGGSMHTPVTNNPLCHNALISYTLDRFNVLWLAILLCEKDTFSWFWIYKRYFSCNSAELCRISPLLYLRDERYGSHSMWMLSWIDHTLPSSKPLLYDICTFLVLTEPK